MIRFVASLCLLAAGASAATWHSTATGSDLPMKILEPTSGGGELRPAVLYLENLAAPRVGTDSDASIIHDFLAQGCLVVTIDYGHATQSRWPTLNLDLAALRNQIQHHQLLADERLDPAHIFIVPSGCRLKRDVAFYHDGDRTLAMDIVYPAHPVHPVGSVIEFSCDNLNRMGNFSLDFCTDTILEGAAAEGYAAAMADHPVRAPYHGLDPMPQCGWITKAAVRTLRAQSSSLDLNGRIVVAGFSRGSGMALLLATTTGIPSFEGHGENQGVDSNVQGAVVLAGRFTYLHLLPHDHMIPRYNIAWGTRAQHEDVWRDAGALDYLHGPTVPLFLSINCTEGADYQLQMQVLARRLTELHSPFIYQPDPQPRGHRVPLDPSVLDPMLSYLRQRLN